MEYILANKENLPDLEEVKAPLPETARGMELGAPSQDRKSTERDVPGEPEPGSRGTDRGRHA